MFLREIELIDFMCHEHLKITPKRLTLIFGKNGSGKSAILEAINLAFGGLGRERQELLRGFIRHGKQQAIIRLRLSNTVILPGNKVVILDPKLRSDADIVIERIIRQDASIYRLNGRRVKKEDISELLSLINISAKNPFFFVPQEKITRLVEMNPEERLDAIMAGLGLLNLKNALTKLKTDIGKYNQKKKEIEEKVVELEGRLSEQMQALSSIESMASTLKNYYIYRLALLFKKRTRYKDEEDKINQKIKSLEEKLMENKRFLDGLPGRLSKIEEQIKELQAKKADIISREPEIEEKIHELEEKEKELSTKLRNLSGKRAEAVKKVDSILKKWKALSLEELGSLLETHKDRLAEIEEQINSAEETKEIRELEAVIQKMRGELKELEKARHEYLAGFEEILNSLDPSGNVFKIYNFIVKENLVDEVQGPILLELSFNMDMDRLRQYAVAIERAFEKNILKSFVVLSLRALRRIMNFIKKAEGETPYIFFYGHGRVFWRIEEQFAYFLHNVPERIIEICKERREEIREKLGLLSEYERSAFICLLPEIIDAPPATKAIIEYFLWDTAIVTNFDAGISLLRNLNLNRIVTIEGEVIQRFPMDRGAIYYIMPMSKEQINAGENTLIWRAKDFKMREFREKKRRLDDAIESLKEEIRRVEQQKETLKANLPEEIKRMYAERLKIKEVISQLTSDIAALKAAYRDREKLPDQIRKLETQLEQINQEIIALEKEKSSFARRIAEIDAKTRELERERDFLLSERGRVTAEIEKIDEDILVLKSKARALGEFRKKIEYEINELKREIKALILIIWSAMGTQQDRELEKVLEEEIVEPSARIIDIMEEEEIEHVLQGYDEKNIMSMRFDLIKREEKIRMLEETKKELDKYKKELEMVEKEIESTRRLAERTLNTLIMQLRERIEELSTNYKYVLSKIGARGKVRLVGKDIEKLQLEITIDLHRDSPVDISRGAFSSGEKTLAVFAFIIALFLTSPAPILLLDEYDVYLDDAMAKKSAKLLKEVLSDLKHVQCMVTTTHRIELMKVADLVIGLVYDNSVKKSIVYEIAKSEIERRVGLGRGTVIFP